MNKTAPHLNPDHTDGAQTDAKRLILAAAAGAMLTLGAARASPAEARLRCWWGPVGVVHRCSELGPIEAPSYAGLLYYGYGFEHRPYQP